MLTPSGINIKQGIRYGSSHFMKTMKTQKVAIINRQVKDGRKIYGKYI